MTAARDVTMDPDGAETIPEFSHDYFAPASAGSVYRKVASFLQLERAAQTNDEHRVRFDLWRSKAESGMQFGGAFPELFASVLRIQNARLPRSEKTLALSSARQTRRLFGQCGFVVRRDVLAATDVAANSIKGGESAA